MNLLNPDLAARSRALARILTDEGYATDKVDIIISDGLVPDCEWCADDRLGGDEREALIEIYYDDQGSVHCCQDCLLEAAAKAASESRTGWFHVEVSQRSTGSHG